MTYEEFIAGKARTVAPCGLTDVPKLNPMLFDWQRDIVAWALKRGRAAIFADCGLGKTPMQLEWARHVPGDVLILAPLAVADQTCLEAEKFGVPDVNYRRSMADVTPGITITNYEMLEHFDASAFAGVVLDESSILKAYDGKTRTRILEAFADTPFRLACTATPAPNDYMELGNHAEFMSAMSRAEMLSCFFVHDGGETQKWRLKGHAGDEFWKWVCSWAVMIRMPSDLGYADDGFVLPALTVEDHVVDVDHDPATTGTLFAMEAKTLTDRLGARRSTIAERVASVAAMVNATPGPWVVWCALNDESSSVASAIDGAVEVRGSQSLEVKEANLRAFSDGSLRVLVTKPSIAGFGLNWQHCHNVAFLGLGDSYEQYYQAIRRCWRFGQTQPVTCHIVTAKTEARIVANIKRKEADATRMAEDMAKHMSVHSADIVRGMAKPDSASVSSSTKGDGWEAIHGDCVRAVSAMDSDSIGYTIFSPPFASLYTYTNLPEDMGNCNNYTDFSEHFAYLIPELFRVTMPGRLLSFHCMNTPTLKSRDGFVGQRDFRGELIRMFEASGWIFHSEVCIWKDPVTAMQRTKALGLLHKQVVKDSAMSRQGIADYLVTMRKPGDNPVPVSGELSTFVGDPATFKPTGRLSIDIWQRYASPVWMDIRPSRTLQYRSARDHKDDRHICPLQLDVIERAMQLWSMPGDLVLSPFMGIASEGHVAVTTGRRFVGTELKDSYYRQAVKNLRIAEREAGEGMLFTAEEMAQ